MFCFLPRQEVSELGPITQALLFNQIDNYFKAFSFYYSQGPTVFRKEDV